jgi:hypothetical protein
MNPKPCKGRGLAKGSGCGDLGLYNSLQKGLCPSCWSGWLLNTKEGQDYFNRVRLKAKSETETKRKRKTTESKRELMSSDAYRSKVLQPVINEIARLIDYGHPCIASGVTSGKFAGGHFISVGANRATALNLHNIHIQAYHSNGPQGGQPLEYLAGIKATYGKGYADYLLSFRGYSNANRITKQQMIQAYPKAKRVRNWLRKNKALRSAEKRIRLRNLVNQYLGIYEQEYR